jgi:hypothetical protein
MTAPRGGHPCVRPLTHGLSLAMPKRSSTPRDLNKLAASIVESATSDEPEQDPYEGKDPAAVELGRRGGLKGGKARAERLTPEKRIEIARKAANARWTQSRSRGISKGV